MELRDNLMKTKQLIMDFGSLKQIMQFEVSRFSFAPGDRQKSLRKAFRDFEAVFRDSSRDLEMGWGEINSIPPRLLYSRLQEIEQSLRKTYLEHRSILPPEMRNGIENLCVHLNKLKNETQTMEPAENISIRDLSNGFEALKRTLGSVHRM